MGRFVVQRPTCLVFWLPFLLFVVCAARLAPVVQWIALFVTLPLGFFGCSLLFRPPSPRRRSVRRVETVESTLPTVPHSLSGVMAMGDWAFEGFAAALVLALGHGHRFSTLTPKSRDRGIDAILLNMYQQRVMVQAKLWASDNAVGGREIREFSGALGQSEGVYGYFVTTSYFTPEARIALQRVGNIRALDGRQIEHLLHTRAREIALALHDIETQALVSM